ncbi:AcrR family transcriptional regulator [Pararhizobium capsulatum DSM 1112]|uniref:AcrR family transcriptional regulator n=1 Tax=Pararhizobium capsulatum DSM 1112 TaxID=1121113 RepID=A0ABU0BYU6_9HYPH|nr:TetR/AcrR family transcriptional regulator [Pararhizobium capsulatum]MDQ0323425.1 AcrR family transcriptional regulator [Pararhizobium capsulatum DSM 1112]
MAKNANMDERRADLLVAVWNVIARVGLDKATVRTIARETGRSVGTLAHYFTDKDDVLVSALQLSHERIAARWEEKLSGLKGLNALRELVLDNLPLDEDRDLETRLSVAYWSRAVMQESVVSSQWRKGPKLIDRLITLVREGQQLKEIRDDESAEDIAEHVHASIDGFSLHALLYPQRLTRERIRKLMEAELKKLEVIST